MSPELAMNIPLKDRFNLPEVLDLVRPLGCTQPDLFDYLRSGRLHPVCFPYRLDPDREVAIEPDEWKEWFRDSYAFSVYDSWIGEMNIAEHDTPVPFHIVPHAARADCDRVLKDGGKAAESTPVYVLRDELVRFTKWLSGAIPDLQQKPQAKHKRDVEADVKLKNCIERVLAKARRRWPVQKKRPEIDVMAKELDRLHRKELGYNTSERLS